MFTLAVVVQTLVFSTFAAGGGTFNRDNSKPPTVSTASFTINGFADKTKCVEAANAFKTVAISPAVETHYLSYCIEGGK